MSSRTRRFGGIFALAFALLAGGASSADAKPAKALKSKGVQSVGAPNNGHLVGAVRIKGSKVLKQREGGHSWGTPQLVHLLNRAASDVAKKHKGSQLLIGDLSARNGGHLDGHGSHQTGRDADVGFYVMNRAGKPAAVKHFVAFDDTGRGRELNWAYFDEARNWSLVESMLKNDKATVHYIFVTNGLRAKLLAYAGKQKHVSKELLARASAVMMSPSDADLHDNHFHVRISCPESMKDVCVEESTARAPRHEADKGDGPAAAKEKEPAAPKETADDSDRSTAEKAEKAEKGGGATQKASAVVER